MYRISSQGEMENIFSDDDRTILEEFSSLISQIASLEREHTPSHIRPIKQKIIHVSNLFQTNTLNKEKDLRKYQLKINKVEPELLEIKREKETLKMKIKNTEADKINLVKESEEQVTSLIDENKTLKISIDSLHNQVQYLKTNIEDKENSILNLQKENEGNILTIETLKNTLDKSKSTYLNYYSTTRYNSSFDISSMIELDNNLQTELQITQRKRHSDVSNGIHHPNTSNNSNTQNELDLSNKTTTQNMEETLHPYLTPNIEIINNKSQQQDLETQGIINNKPAIQPKSTLNSYDEIIVTDDIRDNRTTTQTDKIQKQITELQEKTSANSYQIAEIMELLKTKANHEINIQKSNNKNFDIFESTPNKPKSTVKFHSSTNDSLMENAITTIKSPIKTTSNECVEKMHNCMIQNFKHIKQQTQSGTQTLEAIKTTENPVEPIIKYKENNMISHPNTSKQTIIKPQNPETKEKSDILIIGDYHAKNLKSTLVKYLPNNLKIKDNIYDDSDFPQISSLKDSVSCSHLILMAGTHDIQKTPMLEIKESIDRIIRKYRSSIIHFVQIPDRFDNINLNYHINQVNKSIYFHLRKFSNVIVYKTKEIVNNWDYNQQVHLNNNGISKICRTVSKNIRLQNKQINRTPIQPEQTSSSSYQLHQKHENPSKQNYHQKVYQRNPNWETNNFKKFSWHQHSYDQQSHPVTSKQPRNHHAPQYVNNYDTDFPPYRQHNTQGNLNQQNQHNRRQDTRNNFC